MRTTNAGKAKKKSHLASRKQPKRKTTVKKPKLKPATDGLKKIPRLKPRRKISKSAVDVEAGRESASRSYFKRKQKKKNKKTKEDEPLETITMDIPPRRRGRHVGPLTRSQKKRLRSINGNFVLLDSNKDLPYEKRIKARVWKGKVVKKYLNALESSTRRLLRVHGGGVTKRKKTKHLGAWCCYQDYFFFTSDTKKSEASETFLKNKLNQELFCKLNTHLQKSFKSLYKAYSSINMPLDMRLVGRAFPTAAVNSGTASAHYDWNDHIEGLSFLIPYGKFSGGELVFRDLNLKIKCEAGDLIAFNSATLLHENMEVNEGQRYSMVLFAHQSALQK